MGEAQGKKVFSGAVAAQAIEAQPSYGEINPRRGRVVEALNSILRQKTWLTRVVLHKRSDSSGEEKDAVA